ncbi:TPA: hypothetical protein I7671_20820 [Vibrio vulnificus]|uniref:hypothetical protein n=1 Tax=Vibrio vulnificus TaxID=672 RepID=UPI001A304DD3|nr:hypothetical protein [Vibrio vulnificus]EJC6747201.1 hypothetical protein [Vibrio vulnificus]EJC6955954.1 hypothetical protein [Vibrio vulnificus]EKQ3696879.1 hypothetical protein [Vibrio vulnificus]MCG9655587.1 hypothetical protein [Vibrio vulnificus]HAS8178283.1 hypothetical protein [Vibrio vulnificus]
MTLGSLILLSFLHIAVCFVSPFVFFVAIFQLREFEISKHHADICMAMGGAYVISTIVSVIIVSNYYLADSQAPYYWWFAMPWTLLVTIIVYVLKVAKVKFA